LPFPLSTQTPTASPPWPSAPSFRKASSISSMSSFNYENDRRGTELNISQLPPFSTLGLWSPHHQQTPPSTHPLFSTNAVTGSKSADDTCVRVRAWTLFSLWFHQPRDTSKHCCWRTK
jgi:hypothetical protein